MPKGLTSEDAKRILGDVSAEKCFWINDGPILKNLSDLSMALKYLSESQFSHHLNREKNDFSKWIGDVIGDHELAVSIKNAKTKTAAIKKVNERLETLQRAAAS